MHSSLNRAQAVFGFFTTVACVVAAVAALSTLLFPTTATTTSVDLKNVQVVKGRPHYYSTKRSEYAQIRFDLDADLTPLFNWNTKQVFVYVYATYSSSNDPNSLLRDSEAVIWDAIIPAQTSQYTWDKLKEKALDALPAPIVAKISPGSVKKSNKRSSSKAAASKKAKANAKEEPAPGVLRLRGQKAKYQINDITGLLAERQNVTLAVGWNVQPWVGALWWSPGSGAFPRTEGTVVKSEVFDFPALKAKKAEGQAGAV
ncbi:Signal peptidase 22kDa subunit [Penicillium longicatenatum]|uniref:Signal peptidase 22kDa subunit n=1 Tax=Penicillium longicatenatum TaxID=1561947 RepID=UPI0025494BE0|nr:Signal peptidase 22kDa subunit [Penicillium longicatenatum]KAJ5649676.1 Signal peptidase 22kDa subunit [Penicillium longicatenatum]